jgi:hypothetical protein
MGGHASDELQGRPGEAGADLEEPVRGTGAICEALKRARDRMCKGHTRSVMRSASSELGPQLLRHRRDETLKLIGEDRSRSGQDDMRCRSGQ